MILKNTHIAAVTLALSAGSVWAQMNPVGQWHTIDDKTGEAKSQITIVEKSGVLNGTVEKLLRKEAKPDAVCDQCTDDRKGKLILGMEIIRGARKTEGKDVWEGGKILNPENGKIYSLRMTPIEGGKKMEVRGYIGSPLIGITQTWIRVQ
jgi:uncharacterized protein (DUF2147 family)